MGEKNGLRDKWAGEMSTVLMGTRTNEHSDKRTPRQRTTNNCTLCFSSNYCHGFLIKRFLVKILESATGAIALYLSASSNTKNFNVGKLEKIQAEDL